MKNLYFGLCAMLSSCVCHADQINKMPNIDGLELTEQEIAHSRELSKEPVDLMLYGGRVAESGELPMVFNVGFCTVTVVGPEVIFIASHCVSNGSSAQFMADGQRRSATCTRHPNYQPGPTQNDWALCKFSPAISNDKFVYSSLKPVEVEVGDKVVLNGFGKGSAGRLNLGKMPVSRKAGQEIFTEGSVVLGSGDSGGSVFKNMEDMTKGPFYTVAVNSRAGGNLSIFNYTAHSSAQGFFSSYAEKNGVKICGINLIPCNNGEELPPNPPPPIDPPLPPKPEPPGHCVEEKSFVKMAEAKLKMFQNMLVGCK